MAITNLPQFDKWIARQTRFVLPKQVGLFQKRIALDLFRRVILKSPVGNPDLWKNPTAPPGYVGGRFRANWQVDVQLNNKTIDSTTRNTQGGDGIAAINKLNITDFNTTIWIFNNMPYAERLEMGWSGQAPLGIISVSITEIIAPT